MTRIRSRLLFLSKFCATFLAKKYKRARLSRRCHVHVATSRTSCLPAKIEQWDCSVSWNYRLGLRKRLNTQGGVRDVLLDEGLLVALSRVIRLDIEPGIHEFQDRVILAVMTMKRGIGFKTESAWLNLDEMRDGTTPVVKKGWTTNDRKQEQENHAGYKPCLGKTSDRTYEHGNPDDHPRADDTISPCPAMIA